MIRKLQISFFTLKAFEKSDLNLGKHLILGFKALFRIFLDHELI
jgi:hypothetical protein